jgi:organic hydroperoxide reductase OsmC/OhrA
MDDEAFRKAAEDAKENCPVSQALAVEISLDAALEG